MLFLALCIVCHILYYLSIIALGSRLYEVFDTLSTRTKQYSSESRENLSRYVMQVLVEITVWLQFDM